MPLPVRDLDPPSNTSFIRATRVCPGQHLDRFIRFLRSSSVLTDRERKCDEIIPDDAINLFFLTAISVFVISNHNFPSAV